MDCTEFRDNHLSFLDDSLSEADLVAMQRHTAECAPCARHDTAVRRGLLLCHNLTAIQPSADFASRLHARLRDSSIRDARSAEGDAMHRGPGFTLFTFTAAGVLAASLLAVSVLQWNGPGPDLTLPPVVATRPAEPPAPMANPAIVASVSAGMTVWPTALLLDEAPAQFVRSQFRLASWGR